MCVATIEDKENTEINKNQINQLLDALHDCILNFGSLSELSLKVRYLLPLIIIYPIFQYFLIKNIRQYIENTRQ